MKFTLSNVLIFVAGAAIGSVATWKVLKTKYERIAQEEIDSVKEVLGRRTVVNEEDDVETDDTELKESIDDIVAAEGYVNYAKSNKSEVKPVNKNEIRPYVISPDEFDELDGYEAISLKYYADGVVTDDYDEPVEDVDAIIGSDSLTRFGEYEDDSVFVRNEALKTDYEILADIRKYSDVVKSKPHRAEGV